MKIKSIQAYLKNFTLTRSYTIAYKSQSEVQNVILVVTLENGIIGLGCASPSDAVTGETVKDSLAALSNQTFAHFIDRDLENLSALTQQCIELLQKTPAACAALDIALHDAYAQLMSKPLAVLLGQVHQSLPTSITIGIKNNTETLSEAQEYIDRGFTHLKVKLGLSLQEDLVRLKELRKNFPTVTIRVDPNQGYRLSECLTLLKEAHALQLELIEQPMKVHDTKLLRDLKDTDKKIIALDESLLTLKDAEQLLIPPACCGIFNIKLMKCGGITTAQKIATLAKESAIDVMWGCNDESIISISAALHTAFACSATRYLDLDGSLDLLDDVVVGGFVIENGIMRITNQPGLGVTLRDDAL